MARFNDKVPVAYFDRVEAADKIRNSGEFAALDGREKSKAERKEWEDVTRRRVRRVQHHKQIDYRDCRNSDAYNPFDVVIEVDDVAEEDEIGKFYSHEDRADIVQEKEEETPQQNLFPDQLISVVEDGSGAVSDRGNRLKGSKGRKGVGTIHADNINAVILANIAARIRKRQYNDAAETLDKAARLRAGIIDEDMKPNIGLRSEDNTRLRKLVQETARDVVKAMNRLQEPLSRDMLTEAYLREIRSAHSKEVEKKERRKSSPNLYKKVKRACRVKLNHVAHAAFLVLAVVGIYYFMNWFLRAFDALGVSHPIPDSYPNDFPEIVGKVGEEYLQRFGEDVVQADNFDPGTWGLHSIIQYFDDMGIF